MYKCDVCGSEYRSGNRNDRTIKISCETANGQTVDSFFSVCRECSRFITIEMFDHGKRRKSDEPRIKRTRKGLGIADADDVK